MPTTRERNASVDEFLRAAESLVARTALSEVHEIWSCLCQHACYAEPAPSAPSRFTVDARGWIFPNLAQRESAKLLIAPLYAEDVGCFGETWDALWAAKGEAGYFQRANLIVLRPEREETPVVHGCSVLHEGGHARRAALEGRAAQPSTEHLTAKILREERDMHALEGALWKEAGGAAYDDALARSVYWIENHLRRQGQKVGTAFIGLDGYPKRLDDVLGTAPTEQARGTRKLHFDILANFEVVNRSALPNTYAVQAEMMRSVYQFIGFTGVL